MSLPPSKLEVVPKATAAASLPQAEVRIDGVAIPGATALSSAEKSVDLDMFRSQVEYFEKMLDYGDIPKSKQVTE